MEGTHEFDALLRGALLDGVRADHEALLSTDPASLPEPVFSLGYLRRRQKLLKAPFRLAKPQWKKAVQAAACLLVVMGLSGTLLWVNPTTRAFVERYLFRQSEIMDTYVFKGQGGDPALLGTVVPAYLPEGFVETERNVDTLSADFIYQNEEEQRIYYHHMLLAQGGAIGLDNEHSTRSNITVNGMNGYLYSGNTATDWNHLLVFDEENGYAYSFFSSVSTKELVKIAKSLANTEAN